MSNEQPHIVVNGLSAGTGGGFTVARELSRHLALAREQWLVTLLLTKNHPLHRKMEHDPLPENCRFHWAPEITAKPLQRKRYEKSELLDWLRDNDAAAILQLNGMVIPGIEIPTLSHHQDPWPYRREAWTSLKERAIAALKRRDIAKSLTDAEICGWTSNYLEDFICTSEGHQPARSEVFYNGVPDSWLERARGELPAWDNRPMQIMTVSNVSEYKRQSLVIEALPRLHKIPGLEQLRYVVVGDCKPAYKQTLEQLARSLGVEQYVSLEGRVSDERVQEVLRESRALVLMSVCESFGIPLIEAMTFGTPVVVANCCALPEVSGNAAALVTMDDLDDLVQQTAAVLTQPAKAEELRRAGAAQAQKFSWAATANRMAECFEELGVGR